MNNFGLKFKLKILKNFIILSQDREIESVKFEAESQF